MPLNMLARVVVLVPVWVAANPKEPVRRKGREQLRLGHADLGALGRGLPFRGLDVRPPPQEISGDAHRHLGRGRRYGGFGPQDAGQVAGGQAHEQGQGVLGLLHLAFQRRDGGLGALQHRLGLLHVPERGGAALPAGGGDLQALFLDEDVLVGDGQALFQGPEQDIGAGHVPGEGDQGVVVVADGGGQAGVGGLDAPADLPPEINLPAGGEAHGGQPEIRGGAGAGGEVVLAEANLLHRAVKLLGLGVELAHRHPHLGLGLEDPHPGDLQGQVLAVGALDEVVQDGVVEGPPPVPVGVGAGGHLLVLPRLQPVGVDVRLGFGEVRPHLGAPANQQEDGHKAYGKFVHAAWLRCPFLEIIDGKLPFPNSNAIVVIWQKKSTYK